MQYIPQAPPFVMIDEIVASSDEQTTTSFVVKDDHLFTKDGFFSEPGLIENMAQTAAAGTGLKASKENKPPTVGFIGQIKNLKIEVLPSVGDMLTTTTKNVHQVMNAMIVDASIQCNNQAIASAEFKIFLQENA